MTDDSDPMDDTDGIMPGWVTILLWIAVPLTLIAVLFGIPWIIGWMLRAILGTVFFNF